MKSIHQTLASFYAGTSKITPPTSWRGLFRRVIVMLLVFAWTMVVRAQTTVNTWAALKTAMANGGNIKLTANCTDPDKNSTSYLEVPYNKTVTLDLNGRTINRGLGNNTEGIENGFVIKNLGTLTIDGGGTITGGYSHEGGGGIYNKGTLTINNATISGNKTRYWGAGICSDYAYSSTTIDGATISNNTSGQDGGGISVLAGSLTISNTTITGNTANNNGGGICYQPYSTCSFSMTSGSISNNTAYSGGGIYFTVGNSVNIDYTWDFHIQGGSITHNTATVCGGGVYVASRTTLKISGNITINNNVNHEDVVDNVLLRSADTPAMIQIANSLNANSRIGITIKNSSFESDLRVFTSGLSGKGSLTNFTSDDTSCALYLQGGEARLKGVITPSVSMSGWTYGGAATSPSVSGKGNYDGTVSYSYQVNSTGDFVATKPTTAGTHKVKATFPETTDYVGTSATTSFTISKASLTVTAKAKAITYGDAPTNNGVTYSGFVNNETSNVLGGTLGYTYNYSQYGNTGSYTITPKGLTSNNYSISFVAGTLTVNKKALTIKANAQTVTYGTAITTGTGQVTSSGLVSGDGVTAITLTPSTSNYTTNGTITPSAATVKNGSTDKTNNYTITYSTGTLKINKKALTITAKDQTVTYGTAITTGTGQVTASGLVSGDGVTAITLTPSTSNYTTNGTITPSAATIKNGNTDKTSNYTITYSTGTLKINKKALTITAKAKSITYGAAPANNGVTYSGFVNGENSSVLGGTLSYTYSYSQYGNVGSYTITPSGLTSSNYNISFVAGTLTVSEKALTITAKAQTVTYGTAITTGTGQVTSSGLVSGDGVTAITLTPSTSNYTTNGTITPSAATIKNGNTDKTSNYTITYSTGILKINKKALTITANAQTVTYGTAITTGTGQVTISNSTPLVSGDALTSITLTPSTSDYTTNGTITPSAATIKNGNTDKTSNYAITYSTGALNINKKALTITANAQTVTYGTAITTGTGQVTISNSTPLVSGDALTAITLTPSTSNYTTNGTITPSAATIKNGNTAKTSNYTITYSTGTLTINKKDLAITAEAKSKEYGDDDPEFTYTSNGLVGSDAITGSLARAAGEDYGTYAISQGTLTAGDNYNISYTSANLTINKATLTVTADNKSKTYGDANPDYTVSITGFKNSESTSVLTSQPTAACTATAASGVGNYTITPSGGAATNYSFSYTNGSLTVGAKTLTDGMVAISNNSKVYTGENQKPIVTITDNAATITESDYTITNDGGTNVGNYSVSVVAKGNYTGTVTKTNCFNISPYNISNAGLTITAIDNQTYTGSAIEPTTTVTATDINKVVTADYGYSANTNVGTANITLTGTGNYTGTATNATTFQIVPKALENGMIAAIADQTYTGSAIEPDLTVTYNTMPLTKGTHYTAAFSNNTNTTDAPTVTITACDGGNYSGTASANFSIVQANLNTTATVDGSSKTVDYDGTTSPAIDPLTVNFPAADYTIEYRKTYETPVTDVAAIPTDAIGEYTVVLKPSDNGNLTGEMVTSYTVNVQLPVSLKQSEWTTYYDERFDLATPAGYQAYKVSAASASSVTAEAIDYIPKNVPVILKTTASGTSSNSMTVKFNESQTTPAISGNDAAFIGVPSTSAGVTPAGTNFILVGDKFVLYEGTDAIPAHRCYLNFVASPSRSIEIVFGDEETTGLSAPPKPALQEEQERWYDIQGRRIEKPTKKGMYIKDGQKVVITGKEGWL